MKKISGILFYFVTTILLVLACTKDVGLFTEVEFQLVEQHIDEGYLNESLSTSVTVIPEEQLPDYEYFYSYTIVSGEGYFEDANGLVLPKGENIPLNPLSASIQYKGTSIGVHTVTIQATDTFGFTEEIELSYTISEVPVIWTASSPVVQIAPGAVAAITVTFESGADSATTTYERNYRVTSGAGSLTEIAGGEVVLEEFTPIEPGVYQYNLLPSTLGTVVVEFNLRDTNGQEYVAEVKFDVVDIISVTNVNVTPSFATVVQGDTQQLDVIFAPLDATNQGMTWESDNPTVATVDANGLVTTISVGVATITGTSADNTALSDTSEISVTTNQIAVTNVNVTPSSVTVLQGNTQQLDVIFTPLDATNQGMTWASDNPAVATVDANGLVTTISEGVAIITGTSVADTALSDTSEVTVTLIEIPLTNVNVTPSFVTVPLGNTQQLDVIFTPSDATNQGMTWVSDTPAVATVDANGLVTTISEGVAIITGTSVDDTTLSDTSEISVTTNEVAVTNVNVTPSSVTVLQGNTQQLDVIFTPLDATNQGMTWVSDNPAVATVDANGLITTIAEGVAVITGTSVADTTLSDTSVVTVTAVNIPVTNVDVTPATATVLEGNTQQLDITFTPSDATNQGVIWTSSDPAVATVDANGLVTGVSEGVAFIKGASVDNNTIADTAELTVSSIGIPVTNVNVTPSFADVTLGNTQQLDVIFTPLDATNQGMTWESDNPAVATVDANGLVTTISGGLATITGTSVDNILLSDTSDITVIAPTNDPPTANNFTTTVVGNSTNNQIDVASEIDDPENAPLTVSIQAGSPINGTATILGTVISYTPNTNFSGNDLIVYLVDDGVNSPVSGSITVVVASNMNDITDFTFPNQSSLAITNTTDHTVSVQVPYTMNLSLAPSNLLVSPNATVSPSVTDVQNFVNDVIYTVTAENDDEQIWTVAVNAAPQAMINQGPFDPATLTRSFLGSNSTDPNGDSLTYLWDFGDGGTSTQENPSHTFNSANTYDVTLTVNDNNGGQDTTTISVLVETAEPTAIFNGITNITRPPFNSEETGTLTITGGAVVFEITSILTGLTTGEGELYLSFEIVGVGKWEAFPGSLNVPSTRDTPPIPVNTYDYILKFEAGSIGSGNGSVRPK